MDVETARMIGNRAVVTIGKSALVLTAICALGLAGTAQAAEVVKVGVAAAVKGDVAIVPLSGGSEIPVKSGDAVNLGDKVLAGPGARLQALLLDETVFTIGANSEIVIDRFVYDPEKSAGKVTASIAKGVFRFVTGRVSRSKPEDMEVKVPAGTIGVRGTMVAGRIEGATTQLALLGPGDESNTRDTVGRIEVSNDAGSVVVSRSGYGTTLSQGTAPGAPVAITSTDLNAMSAVPDADAEDGPSAASGDAGSGDADAGADSSPGPSATGFTGQAVAAAVQSVASSAEVTSSSDQSSEAAAEVSEASSIEDGVTQISELPATGTFHFSQDGVKLGTSGSYDITMDLDLGNRTVGGGNSKISGSSGDTGLVSFSFVLLSKSLDDFTSAVFEDNPANANCTGVDTCSAALKVTLNNSGGTVAANMVHEFELKNDTDSTSESGSGTASRSSGLSD